MRAPRAARVSCPACGCRGPATKYCSGTVTVASVSSVWPGDGCLRSELCGWGRGPGCSRHRQPHRSRAAGNPGRGRLWPAAPPQPSAPTPRGSSAPSLPGRGRVCSRCLDLTWETGEAANPRSAPSSPRGFQPRVAFPSAQGCRARAGGGAEGPRSAWTSTSACPPVPRLKPDLREEQLVRMKEWNAVLAGGPAPQAPAFWIPWPRIQEQKPPFSQD